jgi:hypothetical protein
MENDFSFEWTEEGDDYEFTASLPFSAWIGVGESADGSMTNGGAGTPAIICSAGVMGQYVMTTKTIPTGEDVQDSKFVCTQVRIFENLTACDRLSLLSLHLPVVSKLCGEYYRNISTHMFCAAG